MTFALLLCAAAAAAQVHFEKGSPSELRRMAREQGKLIFMDVYASWCTPCRTMDRYVFAEREVGDYMNERFVCVKVDADSKEGKEIAGEYKVSKVPTYLVLTPDMRLVGRSSGARSKYEFIDDMKAILSRFDAGGE